MAINSNTLCCPTQLHQRFTTVNNATSGLVSITEVITDATSFDLSILPMDVTGLTTINATTATDTAMTLTAADLFAANDGLGDLAFDITGTSTGSDSLSLSGWTEVSANSQYTITGNFDNVAGDETYTVNVTDVSVIIA